MVAGFIKVQKYSEEKKEQAGPRCPGKGCCASQGVSSSRTGLQCQSASRYTRPDVSSMTRGCSSRWFSSLCRRNLASSLQSHTHAHQAHQGPELQPQHPSTPFRALVAHLISALFQSAHLLSFPLHRTWSFSC